MTRKLTRITPEINGYAVVIVQEASIDGKPGAYLGCFVRTPEHIDEGPMVLLAEAMNAYFKQTGILPQTKQISDKSCNALHCVAERIERVVEPIATKDNAKSPFVAPSETSPFIGNESFGNGDYKHVE